MDKKKLNAIKQLKKELDEFQKDPIITLGVTVGKIKNDLFHWQITMLGPQDTPYAGGLFFLTADFPDDYPDSGPEVKFINKMYHLNVDKESGYICISTLKNWVKGTTMSEVLSLIFALFYKQNPNDPYDLEMANLYLNKRAEFNKNAKEWTQKYASLKD